MAERRPAPRQRPGPRVRRRLGRRRRRTRPAAKPKRTSRRTDRLRLQAAPGFDGPRPLRAQGRLRFNPNATCSKCKLRRVRAPVCRRGRAGFPETTSLVPTVHASRGSILVDVGCRLRAVPKRRLVLWRLSQLPAKSCPLSLPGWPDLPKLSRVNNIGD
jgi:hypothetical protein